MQYFIYVNMTACIHTYTFLNEMEDWWVNITSLPSQRIVGYQNYNTAGDEKNINPNNLSPMIISPFKIWGKRVGGKMSAPRVELINLSTLCSGKNKTTSGNKDEVEPQASM